MKLLEGLRVLDFSQIMAGPFCTMTLADMGAEVVKVEKINGGDDSRQYGPHIDGESVSFFQLNRNKKSMALDLKSEEGKKIVYEMITAFDIVIENFRPGVTEKLGIDYNTLINYNPALIYCSISGFGQTGPNAKKGGFDLVAQGMSGMMSMTGEPGGRPMKSGIAVYDIGAGLTAAYSILAAYIHKMKTGEGQHVDVSLIECGLPWFAWEAAAYFADGKIPEPTGWRHRVSAPYQAFKTKDKYIMIGGANRRTWESLCKDVLNKPELMEDDRFIDNTKRVENVTELEATIESILMEKTSTYWVKKCEQHGVPAGPINDFAEALNDEHILAREMVQEIEHPIMGSMRTIMSPTKFSRTPISLDTASPLIGEHTNEVLKSFGIDKQEIDTLREKGVVK
ncbi:CoA transferase [Virgibacillus sp. NKC19-3]|uniref:CaiB/BaiF CoA transferase family protein n=1 Tax=Virgibacillus saliphilus TaxID=2831674 RepID=UPI001C9AA52A|nr:CoA transferase [Virgibacillus sp. NKC19-3]MBY7142568.1 CoA transferase [Virgibacillus sp. NKC19-3]